MPRIQHKITEAPPPPARGVKASTFKLLLDTAMELIRSDGHIPSVAEVAVRSAVSRATAYRYFPTRSALITAVIDASLGPVRTIASDNASGRERVRDALQELPERQRAALVLCYYQDRSNTDAAEILGVSVDALESLLSRARRTLKTALAADRADLLSGLETG